MEPAVSFFSSLPVHLIGETIDTGEYVVTLDSVTLQEQSLSLTITITNRSEKEVDLNSAMQLYLPTYELIHSPSKPPENNILSIGETLQKTRVYDLPQPLNDAQKLKDYRFLYAPFGWSGPVILYRLSDTAPQQGPGIPNENNEVEPQAYGSTGDPWKMLVLIYPNIDTYYMENGVQKRLVASMPAQDVQNMKNDFLNLPHQKVVSSYSNGTAELEAHVIVVDRPLTNLEPISSGYWPSPDITRPEMDLYAPKGKYDSVMVFWQASNPDTGQSLPIYGWGLGYWPFDYANGMTYATVFNLSWVWPNDACQGEVFLHEWLHGVTGFYLWRGYQFPFEDLHGAEEAGYVTDANGCWKSWLNAYMRGLVYENGVRKALLPETWQGGSITTYNIQGWRGEYFNNQTLSGVPVLVRDDANINFEWLLGSPHPLVLDEGFSGRWTRSIYFEQGDYKFDLFRDDGMRLKIDGVTVFEKWQYGREWISLIKTMTAGQHTVQVEFFEIDGYSSAVFQYAKLPPVLTVSKTGTGSGTVTSSPAGINCGLDCSETYTINTVVTLTATSAAGSMFSGWSGGGCSGNGTCTVTMADAKSVTATFTLKSFTDLGMLTTAFNYNEGWRVDMHPRLVGDVNGDGKDDLVGIGYAGVFVALANTAGNGFYSPSIWTTAFNYNEGWRVNMHPRMLGDVNGDGKDDLVGIGYAGVFVALANTAGNGFYSPSIWTTAFNYNEGWRVNLHPRMLGDVNGDGKDDLVGIGNAGVFVALAKPTGNGFNSPSVWSTGLTYNEGWRVDKHPRMLGDINGDGRDDLVGIGDAGVYVALANASGTGFLTGTIWTTAFNYNEGWRVDMHPRMLGDVNNDGKDDVIGFGYAGVFVAAANSAGNGFNSPNMLTNAFNYNEGWRVSMHPRLVGDVNGDGKDDLLGFGYAGVFVARAK